MPSSKFSNWYKQFNICVRRQIFMVAISRFFLSLEWNKKIVNWKQSKAKRRVIQPHISGFDEINTSFHDRINRIEYFTFDLRLQEKERENVSLNIAAIFHRNA